MFFPHCSWFAKTFVIDFPGSSDGEEPACSKGDPSSIPGWGRSSEEGNGKSLQYSCLENPMNSMKRQNDRIPKEELPRSEVPNMLLEISEAINSSLGGPMPI